MKNKIVAVLLAMSMVVSPMTAMAAEQGNENTYVSSAVDQAEWINSANIGSQDGKWNWKASASEYSEKTGNWWGDAEVISAPAETENNVATYQSEDENISVDESDATEVQDETEKPAPGTVGQYNEQISYMVNEDGETCQVGYADQNISGDVVIPSEINGLTVTGIAAGGFGGCENVTSITLPDTIITIGSGAFVYCGITKIHIPASVTNIEENPEAIMQNGPVFGAPALEEITVDENNTEYTSEDGVLFSKDKARLLSYPAGKQANYDIPEGVKKINTFAFAFSGMVHLNFAINSMPETLEEISAGAFFVSAISTIKIPASVNTIYRDFNGQYAPAFYDCPLLEKFEVDAENEKYESIDGVLFNKGGYELLKYPDASQETEYAMPDSTKTIASGAFSQIEQGMEFKLEKVKCSPNLISIGVSAFQSNYTVKTIELPKGLQYIGDNAFDNTVIEEVYFDGTEEDRNNIIINGGNDRITNASCKWHYKEPTPEPVENTWKLENGVLTISGEGAWDSYEKAVKQPWYKDRASITSVVIEDGITEIGSFDFYGLTNLKSISIPDSVTKIGAYALKNCGALTEVKLPQNLESIGESAFYGCSNMVAITIPAGVTAIDSYAFARCTNVRNVTFEGGAPEIKEGAFAGVTASVTCPEDNATWTEDKKQNYGGKLSWNKELAWEVKDGTLTIKDDSCMTDYDSAKETPWYADRDKITGVVVSDGVTKISDFAFYGCSNLNSVELPDSIKTIGNYAFKNCGKLANVKLPVSTTKIGESAFYGCAGLTDITIGENVTKIEDYAFARNTGIKTITFTGSAPSIAEHAFSGVKATVTYPTDDTSWNQDTKKDYSGTLNWGDTDQKQQCGKDAYWKVENGVLTISGSGAVSNFDSAIESPWNTESASVNKVVVEDGITSIGNFAFYGMTNLTEVTLPDSVTSIGAYAWKNCTGLEKITLPAKLTKIGDSAFYGCAKLTEIVMPETVNKIDDYAFSRCSAMKKIAFKGDAPEIAEHAFNKVTADVSYGTKNSTWTEEKKQNYGGTLTWSEEAEPGMETHNFEETSRDLEYVHYTCKDCGETKEEFNDQTYTIDLGDGKSTTVEGHFDLDMRREIFLLVNQKRTTVGVNPIKLASDSSPLQDVANIRAYEITNSYSHTRPNGERAITSFSAYAATAGENLAGGYTTAEGVCNAWFSSSSHNQNITNNGYQSIGISVFCKREDDGSYYTYFSQMFSTHDYSNY